MSGCWQRNTASTSTTRMLCARTLPDGARFPHTNHPHCIHYHTTHSTWRRDKAITIQHGWLPCAMSISDFGLVFLAFKCLVRVALTHSCVGPQMNVYFSTDPHLKLQLCQRLPLSMLLKWFTNIPHFTIFPLLKRF